MPKNHKRGTESRTIFAVLAVLFLAGYQITPLAAEPLVHAQAYPQDTGLICGKRAAMIDRLKTRYEEQPAFRGLATNGSVLEVLTAASGTWSILVTTPQGVTCLVAAGKHWEDIKQQNGETAL